LRGIDVWYYNGEIDITKVKPQVDFIIMWSGYRIKDEDSKELKFNIYYEDDKKIIFQLVHIGTAML
jgi:tagatose-1,6-bisphosphate aldolase